MIPWVLFYFFVIFLYCNWPYLKKQQWYASLFESCIPYIVLVSGQQGLIRSMSAVHCSASSYFLVCATNGILKIGMKLQWNVNICFNTVCKTFAIVSGGQYLHIYNHIKHEVGGLVKEHHCILAGFDINIFKISFIASLFSYIPDIFWGRLALEYV